VTPPREAPLDLGAGAAAPAIPLARVVLLLFVSTAFRLPATFRYPSFWAEDGTVFFKQSVEIGPAALLRSFDGSYHTVPRLIVLSSSFLPVAWAPALYALGAGLVSSACLALFARPGFRWLVPDDRVRVLLCWLFSLVPGTNESFFALCTLNYAVFCATAFLALERDEAGQWRMGLGRALLVSFLWFSIGQGLVLAPPLACLFWLTRNRNYLICLGTLGLSVLLNLAAENARRPDHLAGAANLALVYLDNFFVRLAFIPVVGHRWISRVLAMPDSLFLFLSAVLLAGYSYAVARRRALDAEGARLLTVTVLSAMAVFPLIVLVRSYGLGFLRRPTFHLGGRIALVPSVLALLLLWLWLARPARSGLGRAGAVVLLTWTTVNVLFEPPYQGRGPFQPFASEWPGQAAIIEKALQDRKAGRLREPVVLAEIRCRPRSPVQRIEDLTITP
jgi:hypothetical protein